MLKTFNPEELLAESVDFKAKLYDAEPPQLPVTILDMERAEGCFDMELPMADPCPSCGGFCMRVGDYACWGFCFRCYDALTEEAKAIV